MSSNNVKPPGWIQRLVERFCEPYLFEGITGDLEELFAENVELRGPAKAKLLYLLQAIGFFRMRFKKKSQTTSNMKAIWHNYLLTSFRSLKRHKAFFAINLVGLITAITCSLFALVYIYDESQFDEHISDAENIYRLYKRHINETEGVDHLTYETSGMMGPTMTDEYPEVVSFSRVLPWWDDVILTYENKNIVSEKLYIVDSNFLDFIGEDLILGDPKTVLTAPASIALSEQLAKSIFGDENPLGKTVVGINDVDYTVTGIFKEQPRQSSLQYNALVSWSSTVPNVGSLNYSWMNNWLAQGIYTFVKLDKQTDPKLVVDKLPDMMQRHFSERADHYFLKLMPFTKMYLHGEDIRHGRGFRSGSITFVYTLGLSAFLVFLIASVNYVNIMLSRATQTKTEVGIRKVMGSSRRQLMGRFVSETFISTLIASIVSYIIILLLLSPLNMVTGKEIPLSAFYQPIAIGAIFGFIVLISLAVGVYPAMVLSSPPVSSILQGANEIGTAGWLRKCLLTFQYAISIFLIVCTITVIRQTNYLQNKPLGFDKEQVLVVGLRNEVGEKVDVFENELLNHPNILSVSTSRSVPGGGNYSTTSFPEGYTDELTTRIFGVDQEFFETYGIQVNAGRTFLKGSIADTNNFVVNQEMVDFMGWDDAIGKHIRFSPDGESYPIIGVIDNFHYHSLASATIEPMVLYLETNQAWNTSIRIGEGNVRETIDYIDDVWSRLATRTPLDFFFVDQWFNDQYIKESQLLKMATAYSFISILLCALGLYGLTALILLQKQKEISIRKVLGASLTSIISLVNRQFIIVISIAFLVAAPLAHYLVSGWLEKFVYRIEMGTIAFILAGGLTLLISLLIVSMLSIKTANTNPSKTLSNE
ncbi:putative ABC transport system permease protein [Ekhidna lutea]|uniref:Putative ABC transport system permease protein n=1 Tax=Ekhidna lutea TaxID=447679 RepID=A0A239M4I8_EKHLU|nr:FtsX-like permease family protein [Ekhidna lutea]SNT37003.1 putative ABC transport system permease protein [Ekhidna lutea]